MAKRLNKNLVLSLTVISMLLTTGLTVGMLFTLRSADPALFVEQAEQQAEAGNYKEAARLYQRAFQVSRPRDPKYLVLAGEMAMQGQLAEAAFELWRKAIETDADYETPHIKLVEAHLELARIFQTTDWWTEVRNYAQALLEVNDQSPIGHQAMGMALIGLRRLDRDNARRAVGPAEPGEPTPHLLRARELAPDDPEIARDLARAYNILAEDAIRQGDGETARRYLVKAEGVYQDFLRNNPDNAAAHRYYANFLINLTTGASERAPDAYREITRAVELAPEDPENQIVLGQYWRQAYVDTMKRARQMDINDEIRKEMEAKADTYLENAKKAFAKAIELDPEGYDGYLELGSLYRMLDEPTKAYEVYEQRLKMGVSREGILGRLARIRRGEMLRLQALCLLDEISAKRQKVLEAEPTLTLEQRKQAKDELEAFTNEKCEQAKVLLAQAASEYGRETSSILKTRGYLYMLQNRYRDAVVEYEKAREAAREVDPAIEIALAELYFYMGEFGRAREAVDAAMEELDWHGPGWLLRARIALALNEPQEAVEYASRALTLPLSARQQSEAYKLQADAWRRLGRYDKAEEMIAKAGGDQLQDLYGQAVVQKLAGDNDRAEQTLKQILAQNPAHVQAVRLLVDLYLANNRRDDALAVISRAIEADPDSRNLRAIEIYTRTEDPEERRQKMFELLSNDDDELRKCINLANFYLDQQDSAKAAEYLDRALELDPTNAAVIDRRFQIALSNEEWDRAEQLIERAAQINLDGAGGKFLRGRLLMVRGDTQRAVELFRDALEIYKNSSLGRTWLAQCLQKLGLLDEAIHQYEMAITINPRNVPAHLGIAQIAESRRPRGGGAPATPQEQHAEELYAKHLAALEQLAPTHPWVQSRLRQQEEELNPRSGIANRERLRQELEERAAQIPPDDTEAATRLLAQRLDNLIKLANLYLKLGQIDNATLRIEEALQLRPDDFVVVWEAAKVYREANRWDDATRLLEELAQRQTDNEKKAAALAMLANHLKSARNVIPYMQRIDELYDEAASLHPSWQLFFEIGNWYRNSSDALVNQDEKLARVRIASEWFRRAVESNDDPAREDELVEYRLDTLLELNDREAAKKEIREYVARNPDSPRAMLFEAELELRLNDVDRALELYSRYLEHDPQHALAYFRRGTIHYEQGRYQQAIEDLKKAKALRPKGFAYEHRITLALALEASGSRDLGIAELREILEEAPMTRKVAIALSDMLARANRYEEQAILAQRYSTLMPTDPTWPLILGTASMAQGDFQGAQQHFLRACEIADYDPGTVDFYMRALLLHQQYDRVIEFLQGRLQRGIDITERGHLRLAQAYAGKRLTDQSIAHYREALQRVATNYDLFNSIVRDMVEMLGREPVIAFARQRLAENPKDVPTRYLLASLLATEESGRSEARDLLEELLHEVNDPKYRTRYLKALAQLAYYDRDLPTLEKYYKELLELNPTDYAVLNNYAYILADEFHKPDLALPYARRAVVLAPNDPNIKDTLGWVLVLNEQYNEGINVLQQALDLSQRDARLGRGKESPGIHYHLGMAYLKTGDMRAAVRRFERGLVLAREQGNREFEELIRRTMIENGFRIPKELE